MHLQYDEDFVEAAVHSLISGPVRRIASLQIMRFNREREKLYDILDPDERNNGFFQLYLAWFREWGLEMTLLEPLKDFPRLPEALQILVFRQARSKHHEGTELYVNEAGARTGVVAMRPERLTRDSGLNAFLYHELTHLHDMVDPDFGYQPELTEAGGFLSQHRLARERYRLVWDVTIDGRLTRGGRQTVATKDQRWLEFVGEFSFWPEARQREVFESLWLNPAPSHRILVELVCAPRQPQATSGPRPGAACPLCGFPTFAWVSEHGLATHIVSAIRSDFPHWKPAQSACARCAEIYRVRPTQIVTGA